MLIGLNGNRLSLQHLIWGRWPSPALSRSCSNAAPCYIPTLSASDQTLSPNGARSAHHAEPVELHRPLGVVRRAAAGAVGISSQQHPGGISHQRLSRVLYVRGAIFWSGLTLLTAFTHTYWELLVRHTLVGIGEATFVTIAPTFVADLFPENQRGRIFGVFYLAIPVGTAAGYLLGGRLGPDFGWRFPFYIAAAPGFLLALAVAFLPEPPRGQFDSLTETPERGTILGLARNRAFWAVTLGMAAGTFSLGGVQVWMP